MKLEELRLQIDEIDEKIVSLVEDRMKVAGKIAEYKKENGLSVLDAKREAEKLDSVCEKADECFKPYVRELYLLMFKLSREYQSALNNIGSERENESTCS